MNKGFVMTENQKKFAEEHHKLVFRYLRNKGLNENDYYDIVIHGYLRAVVIYNEREDVRKYSFSTIAWKKMDTELSNYRRYLNAEKRKADVLSLDANLSEENNFSLLHTLASNDNPEQSLDEKLLWLEAYSLLNESQWKLIQMRLNGYSNYAISRQLKIPFYEMDVAILSIWQRIKGLFSNETLRTYEDFEFPGSVKAS